jgi:hypothetical protein
MWIFSYKRRVLLLSISFIMIILMYIQTSNSRSTPITTRHSRKSKQISSTLDVTTREDFCSNTDLKFIPSDFPPPHSEKSEDRLDFWGIPIKSELRTGVRSSSLIQSNNSGYGTRSLFVTVISYDHIRYLLSNFPSEEDKILIPFDFHALIAIPEEDATLVMKEVVDKLQWKKVQNFSLEQKTYPCDDGLKDSSHLSGNYIEDAEKWAGFYLTPRQVTVIVVVRRFRHPTYLDTASSDDLTKPCGMLQCCTRGERDGEGTGGHLPIADVPSRIRYGSLTLAPLYHILLDHSFIDSYDYIYKVDADVSWVYEPPVSPSAFMNGNGCIAMQSDIKEAWTHAHCSRSLRTALDEFSSHYGIEIASKNSEWCKSLNLYLYGNFVGFWVPFLRSPANRALARYLFNELHSVYQGGSDQLVSLGYLCMFYKIEYLRIWGQEMNLVCDLMPWRQGVFKHP